MMRIMTKMIASDSENEDFSISVDASEEVLIEQERKEEEKFNAEEVQNQRGKLVNSIHT